MKKYLLAILWGLCLLPINAIGQTLSMSIEEAKQRALAAHQKMKMAEERINVAHYTQKALKTNSLPKVAATGIAYYATHNKKQTWDLGKISLPSSALEKMQGLAQQFPQIVPLLEHFSGGISIPPFQYQLKTGNTYFASVFLEQPIYTGGKITAGNKMGEIGERMAKQSFRLSQEEVCLEVEEAYWKLVEVRELQATAMAYTKTIDELYRVVNNAVNEGLRTKADVLRVEVEQSKANLQLERVKHGVQLATMNLCRVTGLPQDTELLPTSVVEDKIQPVPTVEGDLSARPELALLEEKVAMKRAEEKMKRSDFLPQIGIRAGYNYVRGLRINDKLLLNEGTPSVMVSVQVPIFNWGEGKNKVRAAQSEVKIALAEKQEAEEKMRLEQQQAYHYCIEQQLAVELTRKNVLQAEELNRQVRNRHEAGLDTTADLLEVEALLTKAKSDYITAKSEYRIAQTKLKKALGEL